jgi:hypothetical protein
MINYFVMAGDSRVGLMFRSYIWGPTGIRTLLKIVDDEPYGTGLNYLLIRFYVEGQIPISGPAELKVRSYSTRTKNITVAIPVTPPQFHEVGEAQRREFVLKSTLDAVSAVEHRLRKRNLNIDFALLRRDVESIGQTYLNSVPS